jgi:hypothetical protein
MMAGKDGKGNLLSHRIEGDLTDGCICDFESVGYLPSEGVKDDDFPLVGAGVYPRSTR